MPLVFPAGCSDDAAGPTREPELPLVLRFDWPEPGRVEVQELVLKGAWTLKWRYDLTWEPERG
ncbi:MAG: hypothetical protein H8E31_01840, partial [Planctomycetes bacterium]|nr:hypothetical protein [Planctomycetota bacterium]